MFRGPSEIDDPTMPTSPTTSGGEMTWYDRLGTGRRRPSVRSILPSAPKLLTGRPVHASTAHRCASPVATKMRSASPSDQCATPRVLKPRLVGRPASQLIGSNSQSCSPVAATIAATILS